MRLSTITGFLKWKTEDSTDLDYSPLPIVTRNNAEEDFQFTQEVRVASVAPVKLSDTADAQMAVRGLPLHAELPAGRGEHVRAVSCSRSSSSSR